MEDTSASALLPAISPDSEPAAEPAPAEPAAPQGPVYGPIQADPGLLDPVRTMPKGSDCIWCGRKVRYETDTDARAYWGYCTPECKEDFEGELECDPEKAFNKSRRLKRRRKQVPAFVGRFKKQPPSAPGALDASDNAPD